MTCTYSITYHRPIGPPRHTALSGLQPPTCGLKMTPRTVGSLRAERRSLLELSSVLKCVRVCPSARTWPPVCLTACLSVCLNHNVLFFSERSDLVDAAGWRESHGPGGDLPGSMSAPENWRWRWDCTDKNKKNRVHVLQSKDLKLMRERNHLKRYEVLHFCI